jgi:hypothetical protein
MSALHFVHKDPGFVIASYGRILILRLAPPPTAPKMARFAAALEAHCQSGPAGMLVWYDLTHFTAPPSPEIRERLRELIMRNKERFFGAALVLDREGFVGATLRAALTGMIMIAKPAFPLRLCSTVDEGCANLATFAQNAGHTVQAAELRALTDEVEAAGRPVAATTT